jgi:hypothetical protein
LSRGVPELVRLGVAESAARDTAAIYPLELVVRAARMNAMGAGWNRRFYPDVLGVLGAPVA